MTTAKRDFVRQYPLVAMIPFNFEDLVEGEAVEVQVPANAIVTGGSVILSTLMNSQTSDTLAVGDAETADRYASGIDGKATGFTALTPTGKAYATTDSVVLSWTGVGDAPTQGKGFLVVEYVRPGRANEVQY